MEINKQLFEDVLSGNLKGTFVLRNGSKISYRKITKYGYCDDDVYPYHLDRYSYTPKGFVCSFSLTEKDIIDFIPDTNMKENKLTIEIPDGKIVDWDESKKQNKIVLKDKQLTYEDICEKLLSEKSYFITNESTIHPTFAKNQIFASNCAFTQHQLVCILAKNKLATVAKYLNGEWVPDKTDVGHFDAWVLYVTPNKDYIGYVKITDCAYNSNVLFKSRELAEQAIEILGEETIKLALEPLGI